jgi:hypothetical protein
MFFFLRRVSFFPSILFMYFYPITFSHCYFVFPVPYFSTTTITTTTTTIYFRARFGNLDRARALFEQAVKADGVNPQLWAAFEAFEKRRGDAIDVQRVSQRLGHTHPPTHPIPAQPTHLPTADIDMKGHGGNQAGSDKI